MPAIITIREGDTEPLEFTIGAAGLEDLDDLGSAVFFARETGAATNHVNGAAVTVADSATLTLRFDPVGAKNGGGNAFDASGRYRCWVRVTWSDADITRHPADGDIVIVVTDHRE